MLAAFIGECGRRSQRLQKFDATAPECGLLTAPAGLSSATSAARSVSPPRTKQVINKDRLAFVA